MSRYSGFIIVMSSGMQGALICYADLSLWRINQNQVKLFSCPPTSHNNKVNQKLLKLFFWCSFCGSCYFFIFFIMQACLYNENKVHGKISVIMGSLT